MSYTDSDSASASLSLQGVWIHDPLDAEGTSKHYLYGSGRSDSIDTKGVANWYDGRTFPVVDFGEHQEDVFPVKLQIPHGPDWSTEMGDLKDFAEAKRTLCVRDNRGRVFFGTLSSFTRSDQRWGNDVSFNVTRVDFDEGTEVSV